MKAAISALAALLAASLVYIVASHSAEELSAKSAAEAIVSGTPLLQLRHGSLSRPARRPSVSLYRAYDTGESVFAAPATGEEEEAAEATHSARAHRHRALVEHNPFDVEVKKVYMVLSSHFDAGCKVRVLWGAGGRATGERERAMEKPSDVNKRAQ